jgi:hypothetical protein
MVMVRCGKCGARYETSLPAAGVLRVRRCAECNRSGLEIVDEDKASEQGEAARPEEAPPSRSQST